eukprot:CAMPEP_0177793892 /NCGR_PEP_ID=MMETSP0491_2-20121128/25332_1 /TAXON_ID=63592 /ORGANISM="Tetraselmis chuii, Strain PLY429" /LENGTH=393 /DNA_ID=CAMNT_0019316467 /DNA_START=226 /DNA_END=1407 /DNA_ORIENTATION=-
MTGGSLLLMSTKGTSHDMGGRKTRGTPFTVIVVLRQVVDTPIAQTVGGDAFSKEVIKKKFGYRAEDNISSIRPLRGDTKSFNDALDDVIAKCCEILRVDLTETRDGSEDPLGIGSPAADSPAHPDGFTVAEDEREEGYGAPCDEAVVPMSAATCVTDVGGPSSGSSSLPATAPLAPQKPLERHRHHSEVNEHDVCFSHHHKRVPRAINMAAGSQFSHVTQVDPETFSSKPSALLDVKTDGSQNSRLWLVRWAGRPSAEDSWEEEEDLSKESPALLVKGLSALIDVQGKMHEEAQAEAVGKVVEDLTARHEQSLKDEARKRQRMVTRVEKRRQLMAARYGFENTLVRKSAALSAKATDAMRSELEVAKREVEDLKRKSRSKDYTIMKLKKRRGA